MADNVLEELRDLEKQQEIVGSEHYLGLFSQRQELPENFNITLLKLVQEVNRDRILITINSLLKFSLMSKYIT